MKISELRNGLGDLQRMLGSLGATKQSSELIALIDALAEFDDLTVPDLTKQVKAAKTSRVKKAEKPLDQNAIDEAVKQLKSAAHLSEEFDKAVALVISDRRIGKLELVEIARLFGGTKPLKDTKGAVEKFLKDRRLEMRRQGNLGATIDRMFGRAGT